MTPALGKSGRIETLLQPAQITQRLALIALLCDTVTPCAGVGERRP